MKNKSFLITIVMMSLCLNLTAQEIGTFTDSRDGKKYKTVKIGSQTWFAENLAFKPSTGKCWAYNNNQLNASKLGYLYDWETAKKVCPVGWHLPVKKDFEVLLKTVGTESDDQFEALVIFGDSGFSSSDSGFRDSDGTFLRLNRDASFWCNTLYGQDQAWYLSLTRDDITAQVTFAKQTSGFSVRCIKD